MSDVGSRHDDQPDDLSEAPTLAGQSSGQSPHEVLAAYALGALDVDEQRLYELHLFVCRACRTDLAAYQRTANLLAYALPREQPPDGARDRLLARAQSEASESPTVAVPIVEDDERVTVVQATPATTDAPTVVDATAIPVGRDGGSVAVPARGVQPRRGVRIKLESIGWAAALLFVVVSGLFVYAWGATAPHASPEVELLARLPGGQLLRLTGTGTPTASARLYVVESGRRAELTIDALPPLARGRVYQLWFTEPDQPPRTGGAFGVDPRGDASVQVVIPTPLERVRAVTVTQEPAPGSPAPTGVTLLRWTP